jgi:hypothetical protein
MTIAFREQETTGEEEVVTYFNVMSRYLAREAFRIVYWDEEKWLCTYSPHISKLYNTIKLPESNDSQVTWE